MTFVGRARELEALGALVGEGRVATVAGPPGIGKTRLMRRFLEQDETRAAPWAATTFFCTLTDARNLAEICASIAHATGATIGAGGEPEELVGTILATRGPVLLVLDGLGAAMPSLGPALSRWLDMAPRAVIAVTARAPVELAQETVLELGPLVLPEGIEDVLTADAARLMLVRARELADRDLVEEGLAGDVVGLVRALQGVPLAIELAAARSKEMSPAELRIAVAPALARGEDGLGAMVAASADRLAPALQDALAQCGIFRGGFDVRAAEAVFDLSAHGPAGRTVDVLQALRDQSLLQATLAGPGSRVRLSLLAAIRAWADARLDERGMRRALEDRHSAHYLARARRAVARLDERSDDDGSMDLLSDERENLLAIHRRGLGDPARRGAWALEAAVVLDPLLHAQGPWALRETLLSDALLVASTADTPILRAKALSCRGLARVYRGRPTEALRDLEQAAQLAREGGDLLAEGTALSAAGMTASQRLRRPQEAMASLKGAITAFAKARAHGQEGLARSRLGWARYLAGRVPEAIASFDEALALFRSVGDRRREALALADRAIVAHDHGRLEEARLLYEQALAVQRAMGELPDQVRVMGFVGLVAAEQGRHEAAAQQLDQAVMLAGRLGHLWAEATWIGYRGLAAEVAGDLERARSAYDRALVRHRRLANAKQEGLVLALRGGLDAAEGRFDVARGALDEASTILGALGEPVLALLPQLCRARLHNALATAAQREGAPAGLVEEHRQAARHSVAAATAQGALVPSVELRLVAALGARDPRPSATPATGALEVAETGRWFRAPGGEVVRLTGRRAPGRVLARLAQLRLDAPGTAASLADVLDAGWPGHNGHVPSRESRVYTALWTLRRLGLGPFLTSRDDGYLLDPAIPVRVVREQPS